MSFEENKYSIPSSIDKRKPSGFLEKFLPRFFQTEASAETKLAGRIHRQLQHDARQVKIQLKQLRETIKAELNTHDDQNLLTSFEAIMSPLLREYSQLERKLQEDPHPVTLQNVNAWIEKAKLWVALSDIPHDRVSITEAVVAHTKLMSETIIDRDLTMLEEYAAHEVQKLGFSQDVAANAGKQIQEKLKPHLEGLLALKDNMPQNLTLSTLQAWKSQLNQERANHYNAALHLIDGIIQEIAPSMVEEVEHEHLRDVFALVIYLEEEIPSFIGELKKSSNDEQRSLFIDHAQYLEEQIHRLNQDLRLTPELYDRVQVLMVNLDEACKTWL